MESDDTLEVEDADILTAYVAFHEQHSSAFQAHLHGQDTELEEPETGSRLLGWTPEETDALFHGLAVYSRWRPDLIADSIPGKSTFSVCTYIDTLEAATKDIDEPLPRAELPIAAETPDALLKLEEQYATTILGSEPSWEDAFREKQIETRREEAEAPGPNHRARLEEFSAWKDSQDAGKEPQSVDAPRYTEQSKPDDRLRDISVDVPNSLSSQQGSSSHTTTTPVPELAADDDLSRFSPKTRRRIRNRLHMRKKRANDDRDVTTLQKRGRKRAKTSEAVSAPDEEDETLSAKKRHKKPGKTKYERLKEQFAEWGMDGEFLLADGLGLFRLKGLHNVMSSQDTADDIPSAMSADTIRLLTKFVKDFVRRLMQHVLVSKEQQIALKSTTKLWRLGQTNEITVSDIEYALQLIGFEIDKGDVDEEDEEEIERDNAVNPSQFPVTLLSLMRETLPPLMQPPLSNQEEFFDNQQRLMPLESDEDTIAEELDEEEELEVEDEFVQTEPIEEYWKIMGLHPSTP